MSPPAVGPRATFILAERWDPTRMVGRVLTGGVLDLPVPVPVPGRRPPRDRGSGLPDAFDLEVAGREIVVRDHGTGEPVDGWARPAVATTLDSLSDERLVLDLRWLEARRRGKVAAPPTPEALAVASWLLHDTRVAAGAPAAPDAALVALVAELPHEVVLERFQALHALTATLADDEVPERLAGGDQGVSIGAVVLTDRALRWWAGGRRAALAIPRETVAAVAVERGDELQLTTRAGERHTIHEIRPAAAAQQIADALRPAPRDALEALAVTADLAGDLDRVRAALEPGERPELLARCLRGWGRSGTLVLTDRRLLWVHVGRKPPAAFARADVRGAEPHGDHEVRVDLGGTLPEAFSHLEPAGAVAAFAERLRAG